MILSENKDVVRRLYAEVFTGGRYAALDELIAEEYIGYDPPDSPRPLYGPAIMRQSAERMAAAFPDRHYRLDALIAEDDLVAARVTFTGMHSGPFFDLSPTGRQITFTGTVMYWLDEGRIAASWGNWDNLGLMRQLGLLDVGS